MARVPPCRLSTDRANGCGTLKPGVCTASGRHFTRCQTARKTYSGKRVSRLREVRPACCPQK